jgi:hypothetical protein
VSWFAKQTDPRDTMSYGQININDISNPDGKRNDDDQSDYDNEDDDEVKEIFLTKDDQTLLFFNN